jgi:predicted Zn-ribbon and HTH transcriptional regulator
MKSSRTGPWISIMAILSELQRFPNSAAAYLVKGRLAQEGIEATVRRGSRYQAMGGSGYVVSVPSEQLARAREILDSTNPEVDLDEYVDKNNTSFRRCPQCRSVMIHREALAGGKRIFVYGTLGLGLPLVVKPFRCKKCGHHWNAR